MQTSIGMQLGSIPFFSGFGKYPDDFLSPRVLNLTVAGICLWGRRTNGSIKKLPLRIVSGPRGGPSARSLVVCVCGDVGFAGIAMRPAFAGMPKE
jgi:hypothetical protein